MGALVERDDVPSAMRECDNRDAFCSRTDFHGTKSQKGCDFCLYDCDRLPCNDSAELLESLPILRNSACALRRVDLGGSDARLLPTVPRPPPPHCLKPRLAFGKLSRISYPYAVGITDTPPRPTCITPVFLALWTISRLSRELFVLWTILFVIYPVHLLHQIPGCTF